MLKTRSPALRSAWVALLSLVFLVNGACQKAKDERLQVNAPAPVDAKILVLSDLESMNDADERERQALVRYDQSQAGIFSRIFGGPSKASARRFVDERIRYFVTPAELRTWRVFPPPYRMESFLSSGSDRDMDQKMAEKNAVVVAENLGMAIWLQGIMSRVSFSVGIPGQGVLPVNSARIGIMAIGDGYQPSKVYDIAGRGPQLVMTPPELRQRTLVHESRHSDCTGGLSAADRATIEELQTLEDLLSRFPKLSCGHVHMLCPQGHTLAGIPACDRHPWGAYSIDAVYLEGAMAALKAGPRGNDKISQAIIEMTILDSWSRVLVDKKELLTGRLGEPDMTSQDNEVGRAQ